VAGARFCTFTTPGAAREYRRRYPASAEKIRVLENGFDEESFSGLSARSPAEPLTPGAVTLLHSGIVYPTERDPTQFFLAIAQMAGAGDVRPGELLVRFRAAGHDDLLRALARQYGIEPFVEIVPPIPYRAALQEMIRADGLLVLQAANCNDQIPAKLYEYLRAGRPIVTLTDPAGDTAGVVRAAGLDAIARLDDVADIVALLRRFLTSVRGGKAALPSPAYVAASSRRGRTRELAALLDAAVAGS
jgi:glycosyltransferase involved in cell wall biosynthesis